MWFVLLVVKSMEGGHVIERLELDLIRDCPDNKGFITGKPKEENKDNKQKPRAQGQVFSIHRDAQATSNVVIGIIQIHTLCACVLVL